MLFILCVPHLPVESADGVVGEEPVVGPELGQLDPAEVATVSRQQRRHWQQGVRQLEEVPITAPEFLPVDLRGVPLEGGGGHVRTRFQDSAPSGGMEKSGILKIGIRESCQLLTGGNFRHSHLTFTADKEAESKALGRLGQVAQASGVLSAGIGQGAQEVVCQVAAAFPQGGALGFRQYLAQWTEGQREREKKDVEKTFLARVSASVLVSNGSSALLQHFFLRLCSFFLVFLCCHCLFSTEGD